MKKLSNSINTHKDAITATYLVVLASIIVVMQIVT